MKRCILLALPIVSLIGVLGLLRAEGEARQIYKLSRQEAIQIVRQVNSTQAMLRSNGKYGNLLQVLQASPIDLTPTDDYSALVKSYKLTLITEIDGQKYQAALVGGRCEVAFFTDESGLIYSGQTLGCPAQQP